MGKFSEILIVMSQERKSEEKPVAPQKTTKSDTGKIIGVFLLIVFSMNGVTNYVGSQIPKTIDQIVQINALNDLLVVDSILFAFLGIFANFDYERLRRAADPSSTGDSPRRARAMLRSDIIIALALIAAILAALGSIFVSGSDTSGLTVALPFAITTNAITLIIARMILTAVF